MVLKIKLDKTQRNTNLTRHNKMATDMFYGAPPQLFENAKQLRNAMTPAEAVLWEKLRANRFDGFRFKAQHPIGYFVADFYCHSAKLVIELDGSSHDSAEQQTYDTNRTFVLEEFGLCIVRFRNKEVFCQIDTVLSTIRQYLPISPTPP